MTKAIENIENEIINLEEKQERLLSSIKLLAQSLLNADNLHDAGSTITQLEGYKSDIAAIEGEVKALERAIRIIKQSNR